MRIQEMPVTDRPREKAERLGFEALSDSELLAIFIRTGIPGKNALQISSELLREAGGFKELARCKPKEIRKKGRGIGPAKSIELAAAFEIGKRLARGVKLNHPEAIALITDTVVEGARDGRSVADMMEAGGHVITRDQCMQGIPEMIHEVQVEATFPDGTKLVTVHNPIR